MLIRLLLLLLSLPASATVFQMQTVDQQIKEADGIIIGHYLKSKAIKLEDGTIVTQMMFKMNKEFGLGSATFAMDEIIIHYPGGKFENELVKVEGVPTFVPGENVILMIKSRQDRYWGMNLGFGSFKVVNYGNEIIIVNTMFPEDRNVGQVKLQDFEKKVKAIKGTNLVVVRSTESPAENSASSEMRFPASETKGKIRAIASKSEQEENRNDQNQMNSIWLVAFLAVIGGVFRLVRQKSFK